MPSLDTPPNPVEAPRSGKVRTGRFGELDERELIHLLDTLDDERARARFRESIYISLFVYIVLGWFLFYGPRVLFHQPRLVNPSDVLKAREITRLTMPADIARELQHAPKAKPAPPARPQIDTKTLEAMRKAAPPPTPLPPAPQPQPPPPAATAPPPTPLTQPSPLPQIQRPPQPAPLAMSPIPDAPKPTPNFGSQSKTAADTIRDAVKGAAANRGGGDYGGIASSHGSMGAAPEILSDTMGVDFDPYLKKIMRQIYNTWIPLLPEEARPPLNKQGTTQLRITILPDGSIHLNDGVHDGLVLEGSTHDDALNRAAWGSITGVHQFPPLPHEFHGPELVLRIHYLVNQRPE